LGTVLQASSKITTKDRRVKEADLGAHLVQAGGDVLGGRVAAEHVTLEHLGQVVASDVRKVPARANQIATASTHTTFSVISLVYVGKCYTYKHTHTHTNTNIYFTKLR